VTLTAYESDPYRTRLEVRITHRGEDGGRRYLVFDDTILYPEGGGQPADHGRIGETAIVDVARAGSEIRHYVDTDYADASAEALLQLDWERRFDHMQQHTAQHLITALAADLFGWETTSFHLGTTSSDIELDVPLLSAQDLVNLEDAVAERIRAALKVTTRHVDIDEYRALEVRTRGLPSHHQGDIRLVEISGVDCNTCGGTHVANTAELEAVVLIGTEPMRGGTRLRWAAGRRLRQRLHQREEHAAAIRRVFESADEEVVEAAEIKLSRLRDAERQAKVLRAQLAAETAARLQAASGDLIESHFDDADGAFLQLIARELLRDDAGRPAFLTATNVSGAFFLLSAPASSGLDLRDVGARVAAALGGRGGGSPEMIQGKAGSLDDRAAAVDILRAAVTGRD